MVAANAAREPPPASNFSPRPKKLLTNFPSCDKLLCGAKHFIWRCPMNHDEAQVRMQETQRIIERAKLFTLLPGASAIIGGLLVLVASNRGSRRQRQRRLI